MAARRHRELNEVVRECETLGGTALAVPTDVAQVNAVVELGRQALERFGRIDIWVTCAAVLHFGRLENTPTAVIERVLGTNVMGYFHGAQTAIRQFRRQRCGTFINVCSVLGIAAQPYASAYVASKFAIRGLSDSLRQEIHDAPGIHVCTVFPFAIDTPIYQNAANYTGRRITPVQPRYAATDVAAAIVALARHPRSEVHVGSAAALVPIPKALAPRLTDAMVRGAVETMQLSGEEATAATDGNLFTPIEDGWKVSGGWRASLTLRRERQGLVIVAMAIGASAAWLLGSRSRRRN